MTLTSPAAIMVDNLASTTHANVEHTTPQVASPPLASSSSPTYMFQTCTAHQQDVDLAWDALTGSQCFRQSPTSPIAVHAFCAQHLASLAASTPLILEGLTWTSYHVNPNQDYSFHECTSNIPSWYGIHPTIGHCENFLVSLVHTIVDKKFFPACCCTNWDYKHYNHFVFSQFPQFPYEAVTPHNIIEYHHCIFDYAWPHGVFVPPLSTLQPGVQFGIWFMELLVHIQHEVRQFLLVSCLHALIII